LTNNSSHATILPPAACVVRCLTLTDTAQYLWPSPSYFFVATMDGDSEKPVVLNDAGSPRAAFGKPDNVVLEIDHAAEARLVRKLDKHIVPAVLLLYLVSFLDRVNIGNARLYGLEEDLGLEGSQFQIAVSLVFVTYILCELPSNMVIKRLRPSRWIAFITVSWGIVATLTGLAQNFAGLVVCRLILGALEAGLFPGMSKCPSKSFSLPQSTQVGYILPRASHVYSLSPSFCVELCRAKTWESLVFFILIH